MGKANFWRSFRCSISCERKVIEYKRFRFERFCAVGAKINAISGREALSGSAIGQSSRLGVAVFAGARIAPKRWVGREQRSASRRTMPEGGLSPALPKLMAATGLMAAEPTCRAAPQRNSEQGRSKGFRESKAMDGRGGAYAARENAISRQRGVVPPSGMMAKKWSRPVSRVLCALRRDSHSSRPAVAGGLKRPTRERRGPRHRSPIWSCFGWGLPCRSVARLAVGSCPTVSPLPDPFAPFMAVPEALGRAQAHAKCMDRHVKRAQMAIGGLLSVALSVGSRRPGVTWHLAL